ncbi:MAG: pyridoxal phosphate-dependent aminotransferase [bacterium]|nr:pyridoxal phosphate-dependent aminotransferase [bacterium]
MSAEAQVVTALKRYGDSARSWLVGTPCWESPEEVSNELVHVAQESYAEYGPRAGRTSLRETMAELHRREGHDVETENIVITPGAKAGLLALLAALLERGDELLLPSPGYPAYSAIAKTLGAVPIPVPQHGRGFDGWPQALAEKVSSRARAVVLSSPSNPSGATLDRRQRETLVDICRQSGLMLVCDEAYLDFCYSDETRSEEVELDLESMTLVRSFSKSYAVCGLRLGHIVANSDLAERVAAQQSALVNPPSSIAQAAMARILDVPGSYRDCARVVVKKRLNELRALLSRVGVDVAEPQGGFYLWFRMPSTQMTATYGSSLKWCEALADQQGVGLWPGEDFGSPGWIRLSAVSPRISEWDAACAELERGLSFFLSHG